MRSIPTCRCCARCDDSPHRDRRHPSWSLLMRKLCAVAMKTTAATALESPASPATRRETRGIRGARDEIGKRWTRSRGLRENRASETER
eukprot:3910042-Rhodomonas_salina.1